MSYLMMRLSDCPTFVSELFNEIHSIEINKNDHIHYSEVSQPLRRVLTELTHTPNQPCFSNSKGRFRIVEYTPQRKSDASAMLLQIR